METIVEKNYASCVNKLIDAIKSRKVDLSVRNIIVVPDIYAFSVENRVFRTIGGAFDVEVATFNRLFHREVNSKSRAINRQGAIMLLKKICYETPLACYGLLLGGVFYVYEELLASQALQLLD
jgi:ATP-dependent helicase/DNAse subunit B